MKMDPRHLEMLAAIVDCGGLTEGAEALGKSQPSVSRTLAQLEGRIGAAIFKPGRRPLQPTDLGQALAEQGRAVLKANRAASDLVSRFRSGHSGLVRVGGTPIFIDGVIAGIIAKSQAQLPDVRVEQSYGYADDLIEKLRSKTLDLAILPLQRDKVPADLAFQSILPGLNVVACREGHPLTRRKLLTTKDIAEFPWIAPPPDSPLYRDLQRALANMSAKDYQISFSGGSLASVIAVLTGSDSLTVLPYSVVFTTKAASSITALSLEIGHPDRMLGVLAPKEPRNNPAARRFGAYVVAQFEALAHRIVQHQKNQLWR